MHQWKTIALLALGTSCIMLGFVIFAFFTLDRKLTQKDTEIAQLTREIAMLQAPTIEETPQASAAEQPPTLEDEVTTIDEPKAVTTVENVAPAPVAAPSYKEQLAQYAPHLTQIYFVETYAFDGVSYHLLHEMYNNAEVRGIYEEAHSRVQYIFNEMNDVLQSVLPPQQLAQFDEEQRVWQQMIDARVAELRSHGGSAVGGNVATYLYDETMLRCKDILHNYFDVVEITGTLPY